MPPAPKVRSAPEFFPAWWPRKSGKIATGFVDARGGIAFESDYGICHPFHDDRARCLTRGELVYLDTHFKEVVRFTNAFGWCFRSGYATVARRISEHQSVCGLIDRQGKVAVDFRFRDVGPIVEDCYYGVPLDDNPNQRVFLYSRQGKVLASDVAISARKERVSEGMACSFSVDATFGYRNPRGRWAIPPVYADAHAFHEGMAAVSQREKRHFRWWFIDRAGDVALADPFWRSVHANFTEGVAAVGRNLKGNGYGVAFIERNGSFLTDYEFTGARAFNDGLAPVARTTRGKGKWGYLDRQGRLAINCQFEEASRFRGALALVKRKERYHYINRSGEIVFSLPEYPYGDLQFMLSE